MWYWSVLSTPLISTSLPTPSCGRNNNWMKNPRWEEEGGEGGKKRTQKWEECGRRVEQIKRWEECVNNERREKIDG